MFRNFFKKQIKDRPETPQDEDQKMVFKNFAELFTYKTWNEIFGDASPVSIEADSLKWLDLPSKSFIDYVINRQALPFDGVPPDEDQFKKNPTYIICQMHRLWITTRIINKYLNNNAETVFLDLGAFPFSVDLIIRDYLKFGGEIKITVNSVIPDEWKIELDKRKINFSYVNLDRYVQSDSNIKGMTDHLNLKDNSIDFVCLAHVIEHLYHPFELFKEAYRVLKDGGKNLVSTDNAFMLGTLFNICSLNDFLHEPVENTSAMLFTFWIGHNRFFSEKDIIKMLESVGFKIIERRFCEVLYNSFSEDYFKHPITAIPKWQADILTRLPEYRNELIIIAERIVK
jgi:SAM-dependent methyltransferase